MPILSSTIVFDVPQRDGRRSIREAHTDDTGQVHHVDYLGEADAKAEEMLPIRAAQIELALAEEQVRLDAEQDAEKQRATELLKLSDAAIAAILRVPLDRLEDEKASLEEQRDHEVGEIEVGEVRP